MLSSHHRLGMCLACKDKRQHLCIHVCCVAYIGPFSPHQPWVACSYVWRDGRFWQVPASRADVFKDSTLTPPEKRLLMRFLQKLQQYAMQESGEVSAWFIYPDFPSDASCYAGLQGFSCPHQLVTIISAARLHCRLGSKLMGRP